MDQRPRSRAVQTVEHAVDAAVRVLKVVIAIGAAGVFAAVVMVATSPEHRPDPEQPVPRAGPVVTTPSPAARPAPAEPVVPPGSERVGVARVVDGDTFELVDGRRVRVLGIDSCEAGTLGGRRATERAETLLLGTVVTTTREPGVDRDRYGRELRYVQVAYGPYDDAEDFGEDMVTFDHTGVYSGRNDASDEYLARLRDADRASGRSCSERPAPDYVPVPGGEDDDWDKPRICHRKWWC